MSQFITINIITHYVMNILPGKKLCRVKYLDRCINRVVMMVPAFYINYAGGRVVMAIIIGAFNAVTNIINRDNNRPGSAMFTCDAMN